MVIGVHCPCGPIIADRDSILCFKINDVCLDVRSPARFTLKADRRNAGSAPFTAALWFTASCH